MQVYRRSVLIAAGALGMAFAAQQFYSRRVLNTGKEEKEGLIAPMKEYRPKKSSSYYWRLIFRLLEIGRDNEAKKLLVSLLGCAVAFALIDASKAKKGGELFRSVFIGDVSSFRILLVKNVFLCLALAATNKLLANLVSSLARHWQERLVSRIHDVYFKDANYYKIQAKVPFPHERIHTDAQQLTRDLALVACDMINSFTNFSYFGARVFFLVKGIAGTLTAGQVTLGPLVYALSAWTVLSLATPNVALIRKTQRSFEEAYRQAWLRFGRASEAVALYKGDGFEGGVLAKHFQQLCEWIDSGRMTKFQGEVLAQYMQKYCTHSVMLGLIMLPFFRKNTSAATDAETLFQIRYLADLLYMEMLSLGAMARLLTTVRQVGGIVERVGVLVDELEICSMETLNDHPILCSPDQSISFDKVEIVTPAGHPLVKDLTFSIKQGVNLIICGPNGAGKSSIFRCLGGLWPIQAGRISRPAAQIEISMGSGASLGPSLKDQSTNFSSGLHAEIFYLPQKPYSVVGTLASNVTYPNSGSSVDPNQLLAVLRLVELEHLFLSAAKTGTLDAVIDWEARLSLGEQQRLAMARLFWQRPVFAILDECTSAVSLKMERRLFKVCRQLGVTLITISHRPALHEFHDRILVLDGAGGYTVRAISHDQQGSSSPMRPSASSFDLSNGGSGNVSIDRLVTRLERSGSIAKLDQSRLSKTSSKPYLITDGSSMQTTDASSQATWEFIMSLASELGALPETKKHIMLLLMVAIGKTYLSNRLAHINGHSVRLLMRGEAGAFSRLVATALGLGFAQAVLLPGLDALEQSLALIWRRHLTKQITAKLLLDKNYFRIACLERRGLQAEQVIVEDVEKLTSSIAELWTEAVKPLVDFVWFNAGVVRLTGWGGLGWLGLYMISGSTFLRLVRPDLAGLTGEKERLDGEFSQIHSRLAANSESIAFLDGGKTERAIIDSKFSAKLAHQKKQKRVEHMYGVADQFVSQFLPQNAAWILSLLYKQNRPDQSDASLTHDLRYLGTVVSQAFSSLGTLVELSGKWESSRGHLNRVAALMRAIESPLIDSRIQSGRHVIGEGSTITFESVDIATPGRDQLLIGGLSFELAWDKDRGLMVAGASGSGKSSLLRVIQGLWSPGAGIVTSDPAQIHYIPTRPYCPEGRLADLVSYPELSKSDDSDHIAQMLAAVKVGYLVDREGLFGTGRSDWDVRLSLGEQQRIAVARCLFRNWKFVLLDECTSAVALDGEEQMYRVLRANGMTVITATGKPWLERFHNQTTTLVGDSLWELTKDEVLEKGDQEKTEGIEGPRLPSFVYFDKRQPWIEQPEQVGEQVKSPVRTPSKAQLRRMRQNR